MIVDCCVRRMSRAKLIKRQRHLLRILRWVYMLYFLY